MTRFGSGLVVLTLLQAGCQLPLPCEHDEDCQTPARCSTDGRCEEPPMLPLDADCERDSDCASGWCRSLDSSLRCIAPCSGSSDCQTGRRCRWIESAPPSSQGACLPQDGRQGSGQLCRSSADCASGLCLGRLCADLCGDCPAGWRCEPRELGLQAGGRRVAVCRPEALPPAIDLGSVATPAGRAAPMSFEVPEGIGSLTISAVDEQGLRVAVARLIAPDATVLIDIDDDQPDLNPGYSYPGAASLLLPSTDDPLAAVQAGRYQITWGTFAPEVWDALEPVSGAIEHIELRMEPRAHSGGLLDLQIHVASATGLHAEEAASSAYVHDLLDVLDGYYRPAGVALGAIEFVPLAPEHAQVDNGDEARQMCASLARPGANGASINVFLVQDLSFTAGLAGGIPGPPGLYGTAASGLVIEAQSNGTQTGALLAHELGHFLGLRHTTEVSGGRHDPISDTEFCPRDTEVSACPDFGNLMFPIFELRRGLELTAGQVRVLRGNPALYERPAPTACDSIATTTIIDHLPGFASGSTVGQADHLSGSCGGAGGGEQAHVLIVDHELGSPLEIDVQGLDFDPVVYLRQGSCGDEGVETSCQVGHDGQAIALSIDADNTTPWFVIVDSQGEPGDYWIEIN